MEGIARELDQHKSEITQLKKKLGQAEAGLLEINRALYLGQPKAAASITNTTLTKIWGKVA